MSIVRPFRGLRSQARFASSIASPPYDVLSSDEARELVKNNPLSFLKVNKPEIDLSAGSPAYTQEVYRQGKKNLDHLIANGQMVQDKMPCFYLYQLIWQGESQTGLVALCSLEEYASGKIKKHERTRPEKVNDRADHIIALQAQVGPVMIVFRAEAGIISTLEKLTEPLPEIDFTADDGVQHKLWVVSESDAIESIISGFVRVEYLYIADGHHRSESAAEACRRLSSENASHTGNESYNFFLGVIFPGDQMRILPYYRVVSGFNGLSLESILEKAQKNFSFTPERKAWQPDSNNCFGLYADGKWFRMQAMSGAFDPNDPTASIGSAILEKSFLGEVLGITDVRTDKRVDFIGGIRGLGELERLVDSGRYKMAFSVYPVKVDQLLRVADGGAIMPPKSTWFEPKLRSGLVVHLFD